MDALSKLGIDLWSMALYLVNFGILYWLLSRYLYRPVLGFMDKRREQVKQSLEESERLRQSFEEEARKQQQETRDLIKKMQSEIMDAKAHADERAKELLAEAEKKREELLALAHKQADATKAQLLKDAEEDIRKRIEMIVMHVLKNKLPEKVVQESVSSAWSEIK